MKLYAFLLLALLLSIGKLNGQTIFKPGYIIKTEGDTVSGQIDYRGNILMSTVCKFKDTADIIVDYAPGEIAAYRFIDGKYYLSREFKGKKFFFEFLIKGEINIYYLRDDAGEHYYLDKTGQELVEIPYEEGIRNDDNKQYYYESKKHIGILNYYMQDAPELQSQIAVMGRPEHDNLIKLAEDYHNKVCKEGGECIIYEKSKPKVKVFPELTGGTINYKNVDDLVDKVYANFGCIFHVWLPGISEKMYFKTGFRYTELEFYESGKSSYLKIPCHLEYIYPQGIIRPRISYGPNFYFSNYPSVSGNLGANIKLSKKIFLSACTEIEFNSVMLLVPTTSLSYSLQLGVLYNY